jgi:hypothetical protein
MPCVAPRWSEAPQGLLEVLSWREWSLLAQISTLTLHWSSTVAAKAPVRDYRHILTQNRPATPRRSPTPLFDPHAYFYADRIASAGLSGCKLDGKGLAIEKRTDGSYDLEISIDEREFSTHTFGSQSHPQKGQDFLPSSEFSLDNQPVFSQNV